MSKFMMHTIAQELHPFFKQADSLQYKQVPDRTEQLLDRVEALLDLLEPQSSLLITGKAAIDEYNALARVKESPCPKN